VVDTYEIYRESVDGLPQFRPEPDPKSYGTFWPGARRGKTMGRRPGRDHRNALRPRDHRAAGRDQGIPYGPRQQRERVEQRRGQYGQAPAPVASAMAAYMSKIRQGQANAEAITTQIAK
jgi:hypothetical protein